MSKADADALAESPKPEQAIAKLDFLTTTPFTAFDLPAEVLEGLAAGGFTHCSKIQDQTLPISLAGKDVAGQAQTGTGKTAAFLVTLFTRLLNSDTLPPQMPSAIVVAPTRELAHQILEEAQGIGRHTNLRMVEVVGGIDYQKQADILKKGVDIVIGTPGRMIDYIKQGVLKTDAIQMSVIDEADRLLDLGFAKDMRFILSKLPSYTKRQTMLFSATLSHRVLELTYEYMNLPEFVSVAPDQVTVAGIEQVLYHVGQDKKLEMLLGLLKREEWHRILIFVNTKAGVEWLALKLKGNGWAAEGITGDLPQNKRFQLMDRFKNNTIKILVATDVASRGIHIEDISHVINYDLPQDAENYVHRIGRTARAGKTGRALSLACEKYVYFLEPVEKMLGYTIPVEWAEDDWLETDQCGPVHTRREARKTRSRSRADRRQPARQRPAAHAPNGRSGEPSSGRSSGRSGGQRPSPRRPPMPTRPPGYFPGTFFGFTPPADQPQTAKATPAAKKKPAPADTPIDASIDAQTDIPIDTTANAPADAQATAKPKPKRRRRRSRKPKAKANTTTNQATPDTTASASEPSEKSGAA